MPSYISLVGAFGSSETQPVQHFVEFNADTLKVNEFGYLGVDSSDPESVPLWIVAILLQHQAFGSVRSEYWYNTIKKALRGRFDPEAARVWNAWLQRTATIRITEEEFFDAAEVVVKFDTRKLHIKMIGEMHIDDRHTVGFTIRDE